MLSTDLYLSPGRFRGFMLPFLPKCSVVGYYILIEFWYLPCEGCTVANFDSFDRTARK